MTGVISHGFSHGHYKRRAAQLQSPPEICNQDTDVKCEKIPVYEEELVDVEVCEDTPRQGHEQGDGDFFDIAVDRQLV